MIVTVLKSKCTVLGILEFSYMHILGMIMYISNRISTIYMRKIVRFKQQQTILTKNYYIRCRTVVQIPPVPVHCLPLLSIYDILQGLLTE